MDMPDKVMFETINEPEFSAKDSDEGGNVTVNPENFRRLDVINKAAYDIIRAAPGNENRMIVIPTYKTNHHQSAHTAKFIKETLGNNPNVIATVHYYGEWVFSNPLGRTLIDEQLFNQYDPDDPRTMLSQIDDFFDILEQHFILNGIGVSVGEWGLLAYDHNNGKDALQRGEELKYYEYLQYKAREFRGISLSFWDNGSGINRRAVGYPWNIERMGAALGCNVRSSYSTGLDTLYFRTETTSDVNIPLTLNGNSFVGIEGLTQGVDYTYSNSVVTLKKDYINNKFNKFDFYGTFDTLVMKFSGGLDWEQYLVRSHVAKANPGSGSRTAGITIPIDFHGNKVRRVSCYQGGAPADISKPNMMVYYNISGGNHSDWWPYLEYGGAYTVSYADSTISLTGTNTGHSGNFFSKIYGGGYTLVVEFYDGSRVDIPLDVAGDPVTSGTNKSSGDAAGPSQPTYESPQTTPATFATTAPDSATTTTAPVTTTGESNQTTVTADISTVTTEATTEQSEQSGTVTTTENTNTSATGTTGSISETAATTATVETLDSTAPQTSAGETSSGSENTTSSNTTSSGIATTDTTVTTAIPGELLGDVDLNGEVAIADVLEILKYLAGMKNTTIGDPQSQSYKNACVTGDTKPVIGDVLEILKFLAGMKSIITKARL
jgi:endoglucanase